VQNDKQERSLRVGRTGVRCRMAWAKAAAASPPLSERRGDAVKKIRFHLVQNKTFHRVVCARIVEFQLKL